MNKFITRLQTALWVTLLTITISACGGGGGSGGTKASSVAASAVASIASSTVASSINASSAVASSLASSTIASSAVASSADSSTSSSTTSSTAVITSVTIHYKRPLADYSGWGLHLWGSAIAPATVTVWATPRAFDGVVDGWNTAVIAVVNPAVAFNLIVHKGDIKSPTADITFIPNSFGSEVWVVQDNNTAFFTLDEANIAVAGVGNLSSTLDLSVVEPVTNDSGLPDGWNKSANVMEIFVRSYKDSNGDGKGDLQGVISKLDYLQGLGITGIWLMPVMKSSDHDHGYGVVDYRKIETDYGTMADFDELVTAAHSRGIGVILDYVMNHSSNANPLYLDAATAADNAKRSWFIFSNTNPGWTAWGGSASWHASTIGFYYGVFGLSLPDFNLKSQTVVDFHLNNLRFWLNKGVDGFRFDATGVLTENGSSAWSDQPENHAVLLQAQTVINSYGNRLMVCEAPDAPAQYAVGSSCVNAFAFGYQGTVKGSATSRTLNASLASLLNSATKATMPLFLSNHDSFAGDRPVGELSGNSLGDYKVAAAISVMVSSTPFTYYGEEVGMANGSMSDDSKLRTPMSWTASVTGFSSTTPYRALSANIATFNVAAQDGVSGSLLEHYRALYNVRKSYPVLGTGTLSLKSSSGNSHLIITRTDGSNVAAVLINLSLSAQSLSVNVGLNNTDFTQRLPATSTVFTSNGSGSITVSVPAQSAVVLVK